MNAASPEVTFKPEDPDFETRARASFDRQRIMHTIGARLLAVRPGASEIELPFRDDLTQQHGFLHAGIVTMLLDNACGYAALSLMAPRTAVLTVEFKVNFVSPALGHRLIVSGRVMKPGRTLTVCTSDAVIEGDGGGGPKLVATMLATLMSISDRPDVAPGI